MIKGVNIQIRNQYSFFFDTKIEPDVSIGPNNIFGKNVVIKRNVYLFMEIIILKNTIINNFLRLDLSVD